MDYFAVVILFAVFNRYFFCPSDKVLQWKCSVIKRFMNLCGFKILRDVPRLHSVNLCCANLVTLKTL